VSSPGVPVVTHPAGFRFVRIHNRDSGPVYFGTSGGWRWDDPDGRFGVLYGGHRLTGAFVEVFLRNPASRQVTAPRLQSRHQCDFVASRPLVLAQLYGNGPLNLGVRPGDLMSDDYAPCQALSRQLHDNSTVDGIEYRSRLNSDELCVALFDRAATAIAPAGASMPIPTDVAQTILALHGGSLVWLDDEGTALP
jgi:hypothetical protein